MFTEMQPAPTYFYQSPKFKGVYEPVAEPARTDRVKVIADTPQRRDRYVEQLDAVRARRSGVLEGEYVVLMEGMLAINKNGTPIMINCAPEDDWDNPPLSANIGRYCRSAEFLILREQIINSWDKLKFSTDIALITDIYLKNYYHYQIFFLPKIRVTANSDQTLLLMHQSAVTSPFQKETLAKAAGDRRISFFGEMTAVKDPFLVQEPASFDGVRWLRQRMALQVAKGRRNIYVRRSAPTVENGRSIVQDEAFETFLARHQFESLYFGDGELSVAEQAGMLNGANVVLSMHGANLTNMMYADAEMTMIEVLPGYWSNYTHIHIGAAVGLHYYGLISQNYTPAGGVHVDVGALEAIMAEAAQRA